MCLMQIMTLPNLSDNHPPHVCRRLDRLTEMYANQFLEESSWVTNPNQETKNLKSFTEPFFHNCGIFGVNQINAQPKLVFVSIFFSFWFVIWLIIWVFHLVKLLKSLWIFSKLVSVSRVSDHNFESMSQLD